MRIPFIRGRRRRDGLDIETALRTSLARRARHAPAGDDLAERIIAAADRAPGEPAAPPAPRRAARRWAPPLVAAASVAAVAGAVVAIASHDSGGDDRVASSPSRDVSASASAPSSAADSTPPPVAPTSALPSVTTTSPDTTVLHGVQVVDLTFTAADSGWGIASAKCINGAGRCTALLHTTDGKVWRSRPNTPFNVPGDTGGCTTKCVRHIRFATDSIGYAFGPDALFITTDGAQSWRQIPGGASELETLHDVVVRVSGTIVETAALGSSHWVVHAVPVAASGLTDLGFAGNTVILAAKDTSGDSHLLVSDSNGLVWGDRGRPCQEDLENLAGAPDGSIAAVCAPRESAAGPVYTTVSTNGGVSFGTRADTPKRANPTSFALASKHTLLLSYDSAGTRGQLYRSGDGGKAWSRVRTASRPSVQDPQAASGVREFLGFENGSEGRWVAGDQTSIWTTRDAGRTWAEMPFS